MRIGSVSSFQTPSVSLPQEESKKKALPASIFNTIKEDHKVPSPDSLSRISDLSQIVDSRIHLFLEKVNDLFRSVVFLEKKEDAAQEYLSSCWDSARSELRKLYDQIINKN